MVAFHHKYALFVIRRHYRATQEDHVDTLTTVMVNHVKLCNVRIGPGDLKEKVSKRIEDDIKILHNKSDNSGLKATYHVYYTLLEDDEFLVKACRDTLRFFFGSKANDTEIESTIKCKDMPEEFLEIRPKTPQGCCITPQMCIMGLRDVECTFRSLYALAVNDEDTLQTSKEIYSYIHKNNEIVKRNGQQLVKFGDEADPDSGPTVKVVGAKIGLETSIDIYRYAKEIWDEQKSLADEKEILERQLREWETKKNDVTSPKIEKLERDIGRLMKGREQELHGCLKDLVNGVKTMQCTMSGALGDFQSL